MVIFTYHHHQLSIQANQSYHFCEQSSLLNQELKKGGHVGKKGIGESDKLDHMEVHKNFCFPYKVFVRRSWSLELMDLALSSGSATYWLCVLEHVLFYLWVFVSSLWKCQPQNFLKDYKVITAMNVFCKLKYMTLFFKLGDTSKFPSIFCSTLT